MQKLSTKNVTIAIYTIILLFLLCIFYFLGYRFPRTYVVAAILRHDMAKDDMRRSTIKVYTHGSSGETKGIYCQFPLDIKLAGGGPVGNFSLTDIESKENNPITGVKKILIYKVAYFQAGPENPFSMTSPVYKCAVIE